MSLKASVARVGLFSLIVTMTAASATAQTIWVEGERPARSTMNRHPWWYDQVKKDQLSGGDWISNFSEEKEGEAEYVVEIPKPAVYSFWIRANPIQAQARLCTGPRCMEADRHVERRARYRQYRRRRQARPSVPVLEESGRASACRGAAHRALPVLQQAAASRGARCVRLHHRAVPAERDAPARAGGAARRRPRAPGRSCRSATRSGPMPCSIFADSTRKSPARAGSSGWLPMARASSWETGRRSASGA